MSYRKLSKPRPLHATFLASFAGSLTALFVFTPFVPHNRVPRSEFFVPENPLPPIRNNHGHTVRSGSIRISSLPSSNQKFCNGDVKCVFDLGFNTGQDTHMYLKDSTARVLAVEANPILVQKATVKQPFKSAIASNRLRILSVGISEASNAGNLTFWINDYHEYSSFIEEMGCRKVGHGKMPKGDHTYCRSTTIPTTTCSQLLHRYGTPNYMKIDIEGLQMACLDSLALVDFKLLPTYISTEGADIHGVKRYQDLGYSWFKVVNQRNLQELKFLPGSSGPWGDAAEDIFVGKRWQSIQEIFHNLPLNNTIQRLGWFDLHAKRASVQQ